ncbi:hypothetical protein BKA62DRAFT_694409 [Auriculariales sp. MPI-PUGE-AT-0066]|nr:hypothetical protein BKA62DRAFT_694409 [Auriculariales sp. MPI-PUGE-AT-0066]
MQLDLRIRCSVACPSTSWFLAASSTISTTFTNMAAKQELITLDATRTRTAFERLLEEQATLFRNTLDRNEMLEARVEELERELSVWKLAMANSQKEQKALQRQVAVTDDHPLVLVLIDGDGTIFSQDLLVQGATGGRLAATKLSRGVLDQLTDELNGRRADVWVLLFLHKRGLGDTLVANGMIADAAQFDSFIHGFNQAGPLFSIVDVGAGKEAADNKVKECLRTFARFPQTIKVFFGGAHDNGYSASLKYLEHENLLSKIVFLKGYKDIAAELLALGLPTAEIDGLFLERKIVLGQSYYKQQQEQPKSRPSSPTKRGTLGSGAPTESAQLRGKLANYAAQQQSPTKPKSKAAGKSGGVVVTGLLSKLVPPPCNLHYLASCPQGTDCRYGHHYKLTTDQVETVRLNARKSPCPQANRNQHCPMGDNCIHGHWCPRGPRCFFLKKNQCKFVGRGMHDHEAEEIEYPSGSGSYGVTGHGDDEYELYDDNDYSGEPEDDDEDLVAQTGGHEHPIVMDFEEMGSAMANLNLGLSRGGSGNGHSRIAHPKVARANSSGSPVNTTFLAGKKMYRSESGSKVSRMDG